MTYNKREKIFIEEVKDTNALYSYFVQSNNELLQKSTAQNKKNKQIVKTQTSLKHSISDDKIKFLRNMTEVSGVMLIAGFVLALCFLPALLYSGFWVLNLSIVGSVLTTFFAGWLFFKNSLNKISKRKIRRYKKLQQTIAKSDLVCLAKNEQKKYENLLATGKKIRSFNMKSSSIDVESSLRLFLENLGLLEELKTSSANLDAKTEEDLHKSVEAEIKDLEETNTKITARLENLLQLLTTNLEKEEALKRSQMAQANLNMQLNIVSFKKQHTKDTLNELQSAEKKLKEESTLLDSLAREQNFN